MNKFIMLKAVKIGVGSSLAVLISGMWGLQYATTAGVVTLLTIRNTKKATWEMTISRLLSYVLSVMVITILMKTVENTTIGFGLFMMALVLFSYYFKWDESISVNAVIGTHIFLMEGQLYPYFLLNELGLVVIGTSIALLVNSFMFDNIKEIKKDATYIEEELSRIIISMAHHLQNKQTLSEDKTHINKLILHIDQAIDKAFENIGNTSNDLAKYYVEYLNMRKSQCVVLVHFYRALLGMRVTCPEIDEVADIILEIGESIHKTAGMMKLIEELEEVIADMKFEKLPQNPDEFITKAKLFYILEELEEMVKLKSEFLKGLTKEEVEKYWG